MEEYEFTTDWFSGNIRMGNRRMTRLNQCFSKKAANHAHMMAIYFMHYNFVRIHQTLKVTPAMAAGVTDRPWEMPNMVKVLEDWESAKTRDREQSQCRSCLLSRITPM